MGFESNSKSITVNVGQSLDVYFKLQPITTTPSGKGSISGDVHADSFELRLNTHKKQLDGEIGKGVEFYNPKKDIESITAILKDYYECEPSLDQIHKYFIDSWDVTWKSFRKRYICINIQRHPVRFLRSKLKTK